MALWNRRSKKIKKPFEAIEKRSREELLVLIEAMHGDFEFLNAVWNARAEDQDWCTHYECNQAAFNRRMRVFTLKHRARVEQNYNATISWRDARIGPYQDRVIRDWKPTRLFTPKQLRAID